MEIKTGGVAQHFSEFGDIMDDLTNPAELTQISQPSPVLVIIEHKVLARTCLLSILKREFTGFDIIEMPTTSGLNWLSGRDVRLIGLNIEDKQMSGSFDRGSSRTHRKILSERVRCTLVKSR